MRKLALLLTLFIVPPAASRGDDLFELIAAGADIYVLGETHDNPDHHARQAEVLTALDPSAVVFEMLTADQARTANAAGGVDPEAVGWAESGWPPFDLYAPVFGAAAGRPHYGAQVPRDVARQAMTDGILESFDGDAALFGLDTPLPEAELDARLAHQAEVHCDALPEEMLPAMVDIQRLRDAELARQALAALDDTGGPVVVITGNGHARTDWGMPALIARARPDANVFVLGQAEEGAEPEGGFDLVLTSPAAAREDPCAAFR